MAGALCARAMAGRRADDVVFEHGDDGTATTTTDWRSLKRAEARLSTRRLWSTLCAKTDTHDQRSWTRVSRHRDGRLPDRIEANAFYSVLSAAASHESSLDERRQQKPSNARHTPILCCAAPTVQSCH